MKTKILALPTTQISYLFIFKNKFVIIKIGKVFKKKQKNKTKEISCVEES